MVRRAPNMAGSSSYPTFSVKLEPANGPTWPLDSQCATFRQVAGGGAADYELNKAVLDRIMALIQFDEAP